MTDAASPFSRFFRTSPLRHSRFRLIYFGSVGVAVGYTIQATIAAWLMATLTTSELMVALVQTASTLPTLLFGLAAGALADIMDRRRLILLTQFVMIALTVMLGIGELLNAVGPLALLAGTFLVGVAFTAYMPAMQASVNDLVERADLPRALGLGAASFQVARAVGPALAGAIAAGLGSGSAFLASSVFFVWMILAVRGWKPKLAMMPGVPDTIFSGMRSGLRYAWHSPPMRATFGRCVTFAVCSSALWALLPLIARDELGMGAGGFGMLSASFGVGALAGALTIPRRVHKLPLNRVVIAGCLLWMPAALLVAWSQSVPGAMAGAAAAGVAWVTVFPSITASVQSSAPAWVRARAMAMNMVAMQASLALGSILWGWLATLWGTPTALAASAGMLAVLLVLTYRLEVTMGEEADVLPGAQLPEMAISTEPLPTDGPVLIQVQYQIDPDNRAAFLQAIHEIEPIRRRNGASDWRVFRDLAKDGRFVERFIVKSWAEYVRLRSRMTVADRRVRDAVEHFQRPGVPITVTRLISTSARDVPLETEEAEER